MIKRLLISTLALLPLSISAQQINYAYDANGNIATDARGKAVTTIKDKYGRTIQTNRPEFNVSYTYNKDGLLESEDYSDGRKKLYGYDAFGRIVHSSDNTSGIDIDFTYNKGNIASVRYNSLFNPNGVEMTETYILERL